MLPLGAAHISQHDRHTFAIGSLQHRVIRNLQLPADQIQSKIFHILHDGRVALGIVAKQQVRAIHAATNQIIPAIYLQIKVAACPNRRKALI